eukprot:9798754-Alexandrium_andersonii.AAC.1
MSASLVGSEMCIRDRSTTFSACRRPLRSLRRGLMPRRAATRGAFREAAAAALLAPAARPGARPR